MINLSLAAFGMLLIMFAWMKILKPSMLDSTRDQLFDLRDQEIRPWFQKNLSLDHPAYKDLRKLINGHLRYTEDLTFLRFVLHLYTLKQHPESLAELKKMNEHFESGDEALKEFVRQIRAQACQIMILHAVKTSPLGWFFAIIGLIFTLPGICKEIFREKLQGISFSPVLTKALPVFFIAFAGLLGATPSASARESARDTLENGALHALE